MSSVIWTLRLLGAQAFKVTDNIVYQDNQITIIMERKGKFLSGKKTQHIDLQYFFITDCIEQKEVSIEYCPTE